MATPDQGMRTADMIGQVLSDLGDPSGIRTTPSNILGWFWAVIMDLATEFCFKRTDLIELTQGQLYASRFCESVHVVEVRYNNKLLLEKNVQEIRNRYGEDMNAIEGTPLFYVPATSGIMVYPQPETASDVLTASGSTPPISEEQGQSIEGHDHYCADISDTKTYFMLGDGTLDNDITAENLLEMTYYYIPRPLPESAVVRSELAEVFMAYARYRSRARSKVKEVQALALHDREAWRSARMRVAVNPEIQDRMTKRSPIMTSLIAEF